MRRSRGAGRAAWCSLFVVVLAACGSDPETLECRGTLEVQPPGETGHGSFTGSVTTAPGASVRVFGHQLRQVRADASGRAELSGELSGPVRADEPLEVECYLADLGSVRLPATMVVHEVLQPTPTGARTSGIPPITLEIHGAELRIEGPPGSALAIGSDRATTDASERASLTLDPAPLVAGVGLDPGTETEPPRARAPTPVTREVTLTRPGASEGITGSLAWPEAELGNLLADFFGRVETGPLAIEPDGTGAGHVVLVGVRASDGVTRYRLRASDGAIAQPGDVGVVGVIVEQERSGSCGTYTNGAGERENIPWSCRDAEVTVYSRRSGERLGSRTIRAPQPPCSSRLHSSPYTEYSVDAVRAYVRGFRGR